jgi:hypothetical protein
MGYALVRLLKEKYYILFIYTLLAVTSVSLLWKALAA